MCSHWLFQMWEWLCPAMIVSNWHVKGKQMTSQNIQRAHRYILGHSQSLLGSSVLIWRAGDLYSLERDCSSEGWNSRAVPSRGNLCYRLAMTRICFITTFSLNVFWGMSFPNTLSWLALASCVVGKCGDLVANPNPGVLCISSYG